MVALRRQISLPLPLVLAHGVAVVLGGGAGGRGGWPLCASLAEGSLTSGIRAMNFTVLRVGFLFRASDMASSLG